MDKVEHYKELVRELQRVTDMLEKTREALQYRIDNSEDYETEYFKALIEGRTQGYETAIHLNGWDLDNINGTIKGYQAIINVMEGN